MVAQGLALYLMISWSLIAHETIRITGLDFRIDWTGAASDLSMQSNFTRLLGFQAFSGNSPPCYCGAKTRQLSSLGFHWKAHEIDIRFSGCIVY
jgi:hypothetical protein